jgi:hypothetical protein
LKKPTKGKNLKSKKTMSKLTMKWKSKLLILNLKPKHHLQYLENKQTKENNKIAKGEKEKQLQIRTKKVNAKS